MFAVPRLIKSVGEFFSILGRGGDCYGITVYEGYEGLNCFLMLAMQQHLNSYRGKNQWLYFLSFEPDDDPMVILAETVIDFIFRYGVPKEIKVAG